MPRAFGVLYGSCGPHAIPTEDAASAGIGMFRQYSIQLLTRPVRIYNLCTRGFRLGTSIYSSTSLGLPCCSPVDSSTAQACERATDEMWPGPTNQGNRVPEDVCILTPYGVAFINRLNRYCDDVVFGNLYRRIQHPVLVPERPLNGDLIVFHGHSHSPSHRGMKSECLTNDPIEVF